MRQINDFDDYDSDEHWHPSDELPDNYDPYYDDDMIDGVGFADPTGRSALRAATPDNPRIYPCPTCGAENVLTRIDVQRHYQCDTCADRAEGLFGGS